MGPPKTRSHKTQEITHQPDLAACRAAHKAAGNIYSLLRTFEMNSRCVCDFGTAQHVHPDPSRHWASSALCFRTPRATLLHPPPPSIKDTDTHTHTLLSICPAIPPASRCFALDFFQSGGRRGRRRKKKKTKQTSQSGNTLISHSPDPIQKEYF